MIQEVRRALGRLRESYPKAVTLSKGRRAAIEAREDGTSEPLMRGGLK